MVAMGLVHSWWAVLALPAALLIGLAFGGACMALTTYMRSWQDFEYVTLATLPLFLFSATFFPLSAFPTGVQWVVEVTPLYRGVVLVPRADHGRGHLGVGGVGRLPRGDGPGRPGHRRPPARQAAAELTRQTGAHG